jgi:NTE family protein
MTTAFVFSGGGSLGAVQAGMMLALAEAHIEPDLVVGTSVGAINAAWVADHPDAEGAEHLAEIWRSVRRSDVFPTQFLTGLLGFLGKRDCLVRAENLRHLIAANLTFENLEDAKLPLMVVAADVTTGMEVVLSKGKALDALVASAAIPGVFPPVVIGGQTLVDGGVLNNAPISPAIRANADKVYVLPTGYACALSKAPRGALAIALQSITLMIHRRLAIDVEKYQNRVALHVMPPLCPLTVSPIDFSHTDELIELARSSTLRWLESSGSRTEDQASILRLHRHERHS